MAPYGFQVTMSIDWRGKQEEFSNVAVYDLPVGTADAAGFNTFADNYVAALKTAYTNLVTFKRVRVYGPTNGTKAENVMQLVKDISGLGSASKLASIPAEMTIVGQFYLGRGPKGGKQYIRKYFHVGAVAQSATGSAGALGNGSLAAGDKTAVSACMTSLKSIGGPGVTVADICNENGKHLPLGSSPQVLDQLRVRQFTR